MQTQLTGSKSDLANAFTLAIELVNYVFVTSPLSQMDPSSKRAVAAERQRNLDLLRMSLKVVFSLDEKSDDPAQQIMAFVDQITPQLEILHSTITAYVFRFGVMSALMGMLWSKGHGIPSQFRDQITAYGSKIGLPRDAMDSWIGILSQPQNSQATVIEAFQALCNRVYHFLDQSDETSKIKILLLTADPSELARLRLGEELREIHEKLQLGRLRERFDLHQRMSVRPTDLVQALLDTQPQIVHFSGHGTVDGALCFENLLGKTQPISSAALAALFEQFSEQVKCVVLNACDSEIHARAIAKHIVYVIGMNQAIGDKAAIAFSTGFYQALGGGRTIEEAYKLGCVLIRLQGIAEHLTPVLIRKGYS